MALGLGAVVALFTVVHAVLLRPLPFPQADRLVEAYEVNRSGHETQVARRQLCGVASRQPQLCATGNGR